MIDPISIQTPQNLYDLMSSNDPDDLSKSYIVTNDIDMTGFASASRSIAFGPPFTGNFDGGNHTITIGRIVDYPYNGFFGKVSGGTIQNINLVYSEAFTISLSYAYVRFGGLVAFASDNANINNCSVTFASDINITAAGVGGLIGEAQGGIVNNCSVLMNDNIVLTGNTTVGGLIGFNNDSNVSNCNGVFGNNITIQGSGSSGGLVGKSSTSGYLNTCNALFGTNCLIQGDGNSAGIVGEQIYMGIGPSSLINNCSVTFKDYSIKGNIFGAIFTGVEAQLTVTL